MENKIIAVWGSPGSGKTVTAVKMAKALSEMKKNTLLVGCDAESPLLPLLMPTRKDTPSLGDLLAMPSISDIPVLQHCVPCGSNKYLAALGYGKRENIRTYPEYSLRRAGDFISLLRDSADFIVIDCTSHIAWDMLTAAALEEADVTLKVVNPTIKSVSYIQSQEPLLQNSKFHYSGQVNIINNIMPEQDYAPVFNFLGNRAYLLPNVPALNEQFDSGQMLDTIFGKNARDYVLTMQQIISEAILDD